MAILRSLAFFSFFFFVSVLPLNTLAVSSESPGSSLSKVILDLRETIVKGLGLQKEVEGGSAGINFGDDAFVGRSVSYEFDIAVDEKPPLSIRLLEDVSRWDVLDLPVFSPESGGVEELEATGLAEAARKAIREQSSGVLPPFQLAGPVELWIQDGEDMRLSLPHEVDAGTLRKILLSDGAVVTVKGARSVSLRHPLELPLPLNRSYHEGRTLKASGLLSIAEALRSNARTNESPPLSLRIVGPTSLTSSKSPNDKHKLKLKRLAPGLVELSSPEESASATETTFWPLVSLNESNANLRGFEKLLASLLRERGEKDGSFKLLKADVSSRTYVKMGFSVEKKLSDGQADQSGIPEWMKKPEKTTAYFEVLARVEDNGVVVPERIAEVQPFDIKESFSVGVLTGNVSMSQQPLVQPPPVYFTL